MIDKHLTVTKDDKANSDSYFEMLALCDTTIQEVFENGADI